MKYNTPPVSEDDADEEDFDIGDIEEVIEFDDDDEWEEKLQNVVEMDDMAINDEEEEEDVTDMASVVFTKHHGSVFCCAISPVGDIAVTGGEDDLAYVWDITTGNVIFTCNGHKDSVISVQFSHDGKLLATADMSGYIQVWKMESSTKVWDCEEAGDVNWMKWHHACNVLVAGTSDGAVWKWLVPQSSEYTHTFGMSGVSTQCGTISKSGKHVMVGYEDGSARVFDIKSGKCMYTANDATAHQDAITSIVGHPNNSLFLTSSMDGTAKIYNVEKEKIIATLDCRVTPTQEDTDGDTENEVSHSVEVISVQPNSTNNIVTATLAGVITIWDLSSQVARLHIAQGCGTSQIAWHPTEPIVFTSGLDGALRSYDVRSGEALSKFTGHLKSQLSLDISRDGSTILTTSDDGTARVFRIQTES